MHNDGFTNSQWGWGRIEPRRVLEEVEGRPNTQPLASKGTWSRVKEEQGHWYCWCFFMMVRFHIGAHLDFLQNLCKFWWIHPIFTNFGDIFVEFFVESLKFSLFLVIDFSPILPLFSVNICSPILVIFFLIFLVNHR